MTIRGKLTTKEAAARLGVCISVLRRMVYAGKLKDIKLSARVILYDEREVERCKRRMRKPGRPRTREPWNNGDKNGRASDSSGS